MLNATLARFLNGYMNKKEEETGKVYKEWTDILPESELNKIHIKYKEHNTTPICFYIIFFFIYLDWFRFKIFMLYKSLHKCFDIV